MRAEAEEIVAMLPAHGFDMEKIGKHLVQMMQAASLPAKWEWEDDQNGSENWKSFDPLTANTLERAFQQQSTSLDLTIRGKQYKVDIGQMEQTNTQTSFVRRIRRVEKGSQPNAPLEFPPHWAAQSDDSANRDYDWWRRFIMVDVPRGGAERWRRDSRSRAATRGRPASPLARRRARIRAPRGRGPRT